MKLRKRGLIFEKYLQCTNVTNGMQFLNPHDSTSRQSSIVKARLRDKNRLSNPISLL